MEDVIVVGGGVIGLSIAIELAGQGAAVALLEQGDFGREASWAGAGILPPGCLDGAETPQAQLRALSHFIWPDWAESLEAETGIDPGYSRSGGLELALEAGDDLSDDLRSWRLEGVRVEELSPDEARQFEPRLSGQIQAAHRLPELGQVRNPRLLKALVAASSVRGVRLLAGTPVMALEAQDGRIISLRTPTGTFRAGRYCIAGGAWTRTILDSIGVSIAVAPVRGQIVLVSHTPRLFSHVIMVGSRYLVARDDGRILIGSTEEHVGYLKANTASAVRELLAFGTRVVPALADAHFDRAWSGLRPGSGDGLPFLGRVPGYENLFIAAGHFRSGLQTSPGTARLLRQSLLDQETDLPMDPFACDRPSSVPTEA
jgi:glycine oxidase